MHSCNSGLAFIPEAQQAIPGNIREQKSLVVSLFLGKQKNQLISTRPTVELQLFKMHIEVVSWSGIWAFHTVFYRCDRVRQ